MAMALRLLSGVGSRRVHVRDGGDVRGARAAFLVAWALFLSKRTDADFEEGRQERGWTARKYAAWARGERVLVR